MKKLLLVLALSVTLVGAFSAVALGATANPRTTQPTVDVTHPAGYDGHGGTDKTVNAHGDFTINGDTCSVCHSMHYAGNGTNLTVATNASKACLACHDGTTGNYDVINGTNGAGDLAMGGLFANYGGATPSGSMHDVFGTVQAYTGAPGGRGAGLDSTVAYDYGTWASSTLTCGSCHDAHSSINPRLLSTNPNGIMDSDIRTDEHAVTTYDSTTSAIYVANDASTKYWFRDAPASGIVVKVGGQELEYVKDYQVLWESFPSAPNLVNDANGKLTNSGHGAKPGLNSVFNEDHAYVVITKTGLPAGAAVTLSYTPAFTVQMKITNYNSKGEYVQYGLGVENFCTACHTDFKGSKGTPGHFDGLYHHTGDRPNEGIAVLGNYTPESISEGNLAEESIGSCLTCHFAHGTNQARWDAVSKAAGYVNPDGTSIYGVPELAGSSANKRVPNNAMCVLCHDIVSTNGSGTSSSAPIAN